VFELLNGYLLYCVVHFYSVKLTLSVCDWRWSCNSLHRSSWCCRRCWWDL